MIPIEKICVNINIYRKFRLATNEESKQNFSESFLNRLWNPFAYYLA